MNEVVARGSLSTQRKRGEKPEKESGHVGIVGAMAKERKLTAEEIASALVDLAGWTEQAGKLHREYRFPDFVHAFGFMAASAVAIEAMNHHPDWSNVWNRVSVDLWTHDSGGITQKDVDLARKLEALARRMA